VCTVTNYMCDFKEIIRWTEWPNQCNLEAGMRGTMSNRIRTFLGTALVGGTVLVTGACVDLDDGDVAARQTVGHDDVVVWELAPGKDPLPEATPLEVAGTYQLSSTVVVEAQQLMPASAYEAVQILEGLRDRPAQTMFDLAEAAGVPLVGTLRDALPSALESRLYGWIDGYVQGVTTGDGTLATAIDTVVGVAHADIAHVELDSTLTVAAASATHRLDTVTLEVQGRALSYDVAPLAGVGVELEATVASSVSDTGVLAVGAHGFGLPYGKIAWRALEDQVVNRYGADLRTLLGRQVDCAGMATYVANRCVLGVCVGHRTELEAICNAGLDRVVAEVRGRFEAATVEPIALDAGLATMYDGADHDNVCSKIDGGTWDARLDLGQGSRPAPATFTGVRQ
jgi:hypothetical protein